MRAREERSTGRGWFTLGRVGVESDRDARLVALVGLDIVLHPAGEEHQQPRARGEMDIGVAVGDATLDEAVQHTGPGIAEHELPGARRYLQVKAARQQRSLVHVQEVESPAAMQVDP